MVLTLYFPVLLLLLTDYIFNFQYECNRDRSGYEEIPDIHNVKEDRLKSSQVLGEIPVDDASPVTCSTALLGCVQGMPDVKMSFNLKLAVLLFCIFPFGLYANVGLFFVLKEKYFDELLRKSPPGTAFEPVVFFTIFILPPNGPFTYFLAELLTLTCLIAVLFLRPTDLFLNQDFNKCWQCKFAKCLFSLPITEENEDSVSIGNKMLHHLNIIQKVAYLLMFRFLSQYESGLKKLGNISTCYNHNVSRIRRALSTLWILFSSLVTLFLASLVWVVIASFFFSVSLLFNLFIFSPLFTLLVISIINISFKINKLIADITSILS